MEKRPQKLLDQVREAIRLKQDSIRTEDASVDWIRRYILLFSVSSAFYQTSEVSKPEKTQ